MDFKLASKTAARVSNSQLLWQHTSSVCHYTKMAAGQEANGSLLQLQGVEGSNLPHAKSLAGATEQVCIRFALAGTGSHLAGKR